MSPPIKVGPYQIVRRLGRGMTDVYLAIDTVAGRKVALKLVPTGGDAVNRMVLEAERRGAAIQKELRPADPRMIEVYETGERDGYFFVAMQYVEGHTVAEVLRAECGIEPVRAAAIALELCEQLAKFHSWQAAVVHGDIKPSNIHLGPNDTVRLLDFGIAKMLRANCDATVHQFGSPGYCPPERLERSEVDQQSDLWAVGATLYEMLAGVPPYQAENTRRLEALIRSKRPPRALPANVPRALRLVLSKALAPVPGERYGSAQEFQADLQAFLEHRPTAAEMERRALGAGATIEAARAVLRRATRTLAKARLRLRVAGAAGWFAAGMGLWIGGSYGWQMFQARAIEAATSRAVPVAPRAVPSPARPAPPPNVNDGLAALYRAGAERAIQANPADWYKAEVLLERAMELGDRADRTAGELALSRGCETLDRLSGGQYAKSEAARLRGYARAQLKLAAQKMPGDARVRTALASKALAPPPVKPVKARRRPPPRRRKRWR
jgi:Protein kinase domain